MPLYFLLLMQDPSIADLASRLSAVELEVRADAEARLKAVDPVHVKDLRGLRDGCRDVEVQARLDAIVDRLLRRESRRHYDRADIPSALRVLAEAEGREAAAGVEGRLKELLRGRSNDFSAGGDFWTSGFWDDLAPRIEPLLPWAYPALIRALSPGSPGQANAVLILMKLGDRAVPALCWALKTSTPGIQVQACAILSEIRTVSPLVLASLEAAATSADSDVRTYARQTLGRLNPR